jgi:hypothetical protein
MTPPIAHAGHWLESIVYLVPIAGFAIWLGVSTVRDRRARERGEDDEPDPGEPEA